MNDFRLRAQHTRAPPSGCSTLSYKHHGIKAKVELGAKKHIKRNLSNSKRGTDPGTLQNTALALCYSAQYGCPLCSRSTHAKEMDPGFNMACRAITGCSNQCEWTTFICYVALLHHRPEGHPSHKQSGLSMKVAFATPIPTRASTQESQRIASFMVLNPWMVNHTAAD